MFEGTSGTSAPDARPATAEQVRARVRPALGDAAVLVERVEFEPTAAPLPPSSAGGTDGPAAPAAPPAPPVHGTPPVPPADATPPAIVVDLGPILSGTQKGLEAIGALLPPEAQAQIKAEMARAMRDSMDVKAAKTEAMKAAAAAMSRSGLPQISVSMEGKEIAIPVRRNGRELGRARAQLNMDRTLNAILTLARSDQGEIPFAIDRRGRLYTPDAEQRGTLAALQVEKNASDTPRRVGDWMVVATQGSVRPHLRDRAPARRIAARDPSRLGAQPLARPARRRSRHRRHRPDLAPHDAHVSGRSRAASASSAAGDFHARVPVPSHVTSSARWPAPSTRWRTISSATRRWRSSRSGCVASWSCRARSRRRCCRARRCVSARPRSRACQFPHARSAATSSITSRCPTIASACSSATSRVKASAPRC